VIVCPNCGKENQDHYKFCLGCGSDLPRVEEERASKKTQTPPTGIPSVAQEAVESAESAVEEPEPSPAPERDGTAAQEAYVEEDTAPPADPAPTEMESSEQTDDATEQPIGGRVCASCGSTVPEGFAFCGACGTPIASDPQSGEQRAVAVEAAPLTAAVSARLVLILPDGTEGGHVDVPATEVAVGRDAGGFFANDPFLSPTHAIFRATEDEVMVRDAESLNGTFAKISPNEPVEIRSGDIFRIGQELILFEEIDKGSDAPDGTVRMGSPIEGLWGRVALIVGNGRLGNAFTIAGESIVLGRERGDIIFPEDGYVSGIHLKLYNESGRFFLNDLGSSNGTFLRLTDELALLSGSFLLMGQQLFRVDI
jgi:pSer/pThr/pTyr-binding forkhead associated (FHA) protein